MASFDAREEERTVGTVGTHAKRWSSYKTRFLAVHCQKLPAGTSIEDVYMSAEKFNETREAWRKLTAGEKTGRAMQYRITPNATTYPPEPSQEVVAPVETKVEEDIDDFKKELADDDQFAEALKTEENRAITTRLNINEMFSRASITEFEKGVVKGLDILNDLRKALSGINGPEADQWTTMISRTEALAERTRTIIGVVGATGAGKSSVINAMLDEERLLPTNCMRACTAVVTEISYNYRDELYRAEIEFISQDDWQKELTMLYQELLDSSGNVAREAVLNEDSEAGIAYAKLKAVYPHLTKEDMANAKPEDLMKHKNAKVCGTTRELDSENPANFYHLLQQYVDSKEKVRGPGRKPTDAPTVRTIEYWPLIKVVRLYVRAPALETGAVIVDLPGVHDSNQARAAVAQNYMKCCTGLWIVAPITRAVDDKSAKTLLGETFKRQLKIDGAYNSVTFICSKTDDISITEAVDSLKLDEKLQSAYDNIQRLTNVRKELQSRLDAQKQLHADVNAAVDKADDELEVWDELLLKCQAGKVVYAPREKKRKKSRSPKARKRSRYAEPDSDDDFIASDNSDESDREAEESDEEEQSREPITEEDALEKTEELRTTKKEGRRQRSEIEKVMKDLRQQIAATKEEQEKSDAIISTECITGRNNYSREAIKQDFAAGIKELDQEIAEEEDAANFNPDDEIRDYDEVAASLPVFCVSARGYQKLQGRFKKDKHVLGFEDIESTELPALQRHCSKLTEATREGACKKFLNNLNALLNSLRLWSSSDGSTAHLTDEQLKREGDVLDDKLKKLDTALEKQVRQILQSIKDELKDHLYTVFPVAIQAAKNQADATQASWGAHRLDGGLPWSTYKAVVRRQGVYTNARGPIHFNQQLTEPVIKNIANGWEKTFARRIPGALSSLVAAVDQLVRTFHNDVEKRALRNGGNIGRLMMLKHGLASYREIVADASNKTKQEIAEKQREINREFVPVVARAMNPAYDYCTDERGPGSFKRMKAFMATHIANVTGGTESNVQDMFTESTQYVHGEITKMLKDVGDKLETSIDEIFLTMKRDYVQCIMGINTANAERLPREQRKVREEVNDIVSASRLRFERVLGLASPFPEPEANLPVQSESLQQEKEEPHPEEHAIPDNLRSLETPIETHDEANTVTTNDEAVKASTSQDSAVVSTTDHDPNIASTDAVMSGVKEEAVTDEDSLPEVSQIFSSPRSKAAAITSTPASVLSGGYTPSIGAHTLTTASNKMTEPTAADRISWNWNSPAVSDKFASKDANESSKENSPGLPLFLDESIDELWS